MWGVHREISMESNEDEPLAGLGHTEVRRIEQHGVDAIPAPACQIGLNLINDAHLSHARYVLHDERSRLKLSNQSHELPVETVLWVINQSSMVPHLSLIHI